jgi:hypothetical protein
MWTGGKLYDPNTSTFESSALRSGNLFILR